MYFNNIDQLDVVYIYKHSGQTELDYTLWTEDSVFLFEAKKEKKNIYDKSLMLGWRNLLTLLLDLKIMAT